MESPTLLLIFWELSWFLMAWAIVSRCLVRRFPAARHESDFEVVDWLDLSDMVLGKILLIKAISYRE